MTVSELKVADPQHKQKMLRLLEDVKLRIEKGTTISVTVCELQTGHCFEVASQGNASRLEIVGMMNCIIHDEIKKCNV